MTALEILHNHKNDIDLGEIICYDIETTGLDTDEDEILQLSIIDGYQHVLFNEYIRPKHHTEWEGAQNVNGISPDDVKDKPTFDHYKNEIQDIFSKAKLIVGYNNVQFDNRIMNALGIHSPTDALQFDVMLEFAPIYGEWNEEYNDWEWQKLCVCADYYGYKNSENFHDSLEDTKATLHCFFAMCEFEKIKKELGLENKAFEEMTDQELCSLYEVSDEFGQLYNDELKREILFRTQLALICDKIEPKDIWDFADGYNAHSLFDLWRDLDQFNVDQRHFIQNCLKLIKENESIKSGLAV